MIYLVILIVFIILSFLSEKIIYKLDNSLDKNLINKVLIFLPNMIIPILIYNKYETSMQTLSYMMLVPFLIIISIMDFRTIYVYDIVILSGIIMQSVILLLSKNGLNG